MAETQQHLQNATGQALLALDRLVGIGVGAEVDRRADVARLAQFLFQHLDGIGLGDQPGLEVDARRQVPIRMAGPRITVDAAVLAAAIGIDRAVEGNVRRLVAGDDGPGDLHPHLGGPGRRDFVLPVVIHRHGAGRRIAVVRIAAGATAAWREGGGHGKSPKRLLYIDTVIHGVFHSQGQVPDGHARGGYNPPCRNGPAMVDEKNLIHPTHAPP
ncbi:hypothetical protein D3C76_892890 [compost metagenome]